MDFVWQNPMLVIDVGKLEFREVKYYYTEKKCRTMAYFGWQFGNLR